MPRSSRPVRPPAAPAPGPPAAARAKRFSPSGPLPAAPAVRNERPRPSDTRYPVKAAVFEQLQQFAEHPTAPDSLPTEKPDAAVALDTAATPAAAAPGMPLPGAPVQPPPAAPSGPAPNLGVTVTGIA